MRGAAALGVVLYHCIMVAKLGNLDDAYLRPIDLTDPWLVTQHVLLAMFNGPACVTLFFVLSGAVLAMSQSQEAVPIGAFWIKRLFRLYPLLVFAATMAAALQTCFFGTELLPNATTWFNEDYKVPLTDLPHAWAANATGVKSSLNSPAWSIKVEIIGSMIFPFILLLVRSLPRALVSILVLTMGMFLLPGHPQHYSYMNLFTLSFVLGAMVPLWGQGPATLFLRQRPKLRLSAIAALILAMMWARRLLAPETFAPAGAILIETLCATALVAIALFGREHRFHRHPWVVRLSLSSYSLYLLHLPVLFVFAHLLLPRLPQNLSGSEYLITTALLAAATLAITLPFAWMMYTLLEKPLVRLGHRLTAVVQGPAAPAALGSLKARPER